MFLIIFGKLLLRCSCLRGTFSEAVIKHHDQRKKKAFNVRLWFWGLGSMMTKWRHGGGNRWELTSQTSHKLAAERAQSRNSRRVLKSQNLLKWHTSSCKATAANLSPNGTKYSNDWHSRWHPIQTTTVSSTKIYHLNSMSGFTDKNLICFPLNTNTKRSIWQITITSNLLCEVWVDYSKESNSSPACSMRLLEKMVALIN